MENKTFKKIGAIVYSMWTDIRRSLTPQIRRILILSLVSIVVSILGLVIYQYVGHKIEDINAQHISYVDKAQLESQYLKSKEAALISSLQTPEGWVDHIYESLLREPLVIAHSDIRENKLLLTLVGRSADFFNWYNKTSKELIYCHFRIVSISTQGDSISFVCAID